MILLLYVLPDEHVIIMYEISEEKLLNLRDMFQPELIITVMITLMFYGIEYNISVRPYLGCNDKNDSGSCFTLFPPFIRHVEHIKMKQL